MLENQHKRSLYSDIGRLKLLMPWIGKERIDKLHAGLLAPWIAARQKQGTAVGTINHGLKVVRRILNLAATDPVTEPQAALERRNTVITLMREQGMIDTTQADAAMAR